MRSGRGATTKARCPSMRAVRSSAPRTSTASSTGRSSWRTGWPRAPRCGSASRSSGSTSRSAACSPSRTRARPTCCSRASPSRTGTCASSCSRSSRPTRSACDASRRRGRDMRRRFNPRFSRRGFLAGAGLGLAATPFVPILRSRAADGPPLRLLLLFSANGTIRDAWLPSGGETDFTLGPILSPLTPYRDDIIVIDGLQYNGGGAGNNHMAGPSKFSCGSGLLAGSEFDGGGDASSGWGGGTSIDQTYATIAGKETPFNSLEIGVRIGSANPRTRLAYAGPNQPIPPENSPWAVFERLFAEFGASAAELAQLKAERRSVIDVGKAQIDTLQNEVAPEDRLKVEAHLDGIREIETRLDLEGSYGEACEVPVVGAEVDPMATDNYPAITRLHMDLLVMAFACDLTRASTFMWNGSTSGQTFPWLGIGTSHHDLSHEGDSNTGAQDDLVAINTWYAGEFAYLIEKLKAIPEGDGTMLDNTIVLWGNELGKGNDHTRTRIPFVMAGGKNAGLQTGRFLQYTDVENNRLLVSILNALGIDVDTYGDLDDGTGPLSGL